MSPGRGDRNRAIPFHRPYRGSPHFSCIAGGWQSPRRPNFRDASRLREATMWPAGIGKPFDLRLKVHDTICRKLVDRWSALARPWSDDHKIERIGWNCVDREHERYMLKVLL